MTVVGCYLYWTMCDRQRSGSRSRPPQYRIPSCKKKKKKYKTKKNFLLYRKSA